MVINQPQSSDKKMQDLVEAYGTALVARLDEMDVLAGQLVADAPFDAVRHPLEEIHKLAHKTTGTAAMFGYASVTDHAGAIESGIQPLLEAARPLTIEEIAAIGVQIAGLKKLVSVKPDAESPPHVQSDASAAHAKAVQFVILVAPPGDSADALERDIELSGYRVQRVTENLDSITGAGQGRAGAILLHGALPDAFTVCRKLTRVLCQEYRSSVPIIFLSDSGDMETHLRAVRSGAKAFVTAPLDSGRIARKIEELSQSVLLAPHRVLIVEDEDAPAPKTLDAFVGPGYAARVLNETSALLDWLQTYDTELIVMDLAVAGDSGVDLAKVVWQRDDFRHVAMLFLTPGADFNLALLQLGLSDEFFVPRPLDINALRIAAARYLADLQSGRRTSNFSELSGYLELVGRLLSPSGPPAGATDDRTPAAGVAQAAPRGRPKVLVVDDDTHLVDALALRFSEYGVEVLKAFSGEQGFKVAWEEHPDFIITDYAMPDGTGEYLVNRLKEADDTRHIPVMVLTGHKVEGHKDFALERDFMGRLGAVGFVAKPISLDALIAEVGRYIPLSSTDYP